MNWALDLSSSSAFAIGSSERWPAMSRKKMYSHAFRFTGRDSIFVRFTLWFANGCSIRKSAPTSSRAEKRMEVLSSPVGADACFPRMMNRVKLFVLSWIRFRIAFSP
ncbi:MAG: hypothetical protein H6Q83_527 [Deltaproteobacteria bacterium]|nr:hypothetical protein [Deltaproteobacteria bacterium]